MNEIKIRLSEDSDSDEIFILIKTAFEGMPYADGDEQEIPKKLSEADAMSLSLAAVFQERIVGHISFSPAFPEDGSEGWFTLAPLSVHPEFQKKGIGSMLAQEGLKRLKQEGASGCIVVGDTNYYTRFGFTVSPAHCPSPSFAEHFMILAFQKTIPAGIIHFHDVFG